MARDNARTQAARHYAALSKLVARMNRGDEGAEREASEYALGAGHEGGRYTVVLACGGPAVRITGKWANGEPLSAALEYQNWLTRWRGYESNDPGKQETVLLRFVRHCLA